MIRKIALPALTILFITSAVCALASDQLTVTDLTSKKLCYRPGESAEFTSNIINSSSQPLSAELELAIVSEIDKIEPVVKKSIRVEPGQTLPFKASWKVPKDRKWGHEARLILTGSGTGQKITSHAFFAVGKEAWQVGHWGGICNAGRLSVDEVQKLGVEFFRRWHYTCVDYFSWQPSGWETMAPSEDEWISGQTGFLESKRNIRALINGCHELGINVVSYHQGNSWGPAGIEFLRTHPDWWNYDRFGHPFPGGCSFDMETIDKTSKGEILPSISTVFLSSGVLWKPEMRDFMFKQLKESVDMFGWDGFRSDGIPAPGNVYDYTGKFHKVVSNNADAELAKWIREVRRWLAKNVSPDCRMHFNAGSVSYGMEKQDPKLFEAKAENSYCLWESGYLASQSGTDLNDMRTFAKYLHDEVDASRRVNGYRHVGYMRSMSELLEATATACGAQIDWNGGYDSKPYPATWGPFAYRTFTFRFSRFFWDPALKHVDNAKSFLSVEAGGNVWWNDLVQERIEADGTRYLMVHLINLPENYPTNQATPGPVKNIKLTISGAKSSISDAFVLTPDGDTPYDEFCRKLDIEKEDGSAKVTLPQLKTWCILVFRTKAHTN